MSLPRFFLDGQVLGAEVAPTFPLRLSAEDTRHARALRLAPGEHIAVVDAARDYFECEVVEVDAGGMAVRIAAHEGAAADGASVILLQGVAKGDKMDSVIRHATELGVSAFIPLACERSVVRLDEKRAAKRLERWRAIAKSAAMQSGQPAIPEVAGIMTAGDAAALLSGATCILVCWEEARAGAIGRAVRASLEQLRIPAEDARVAVVVGPEGGLSESEVDAFLACNPRACTVTLGRSILRTETAGIVAPALVLYELGGLQ